MKGLRRIGWITWLLIVVAANAEAQNVARKSPGVAFAMSGLGMLVPGTVVYYRLTDGSAGLDGSTFAILAAGAVVGPALGHIYAENYGRAWTGISFRLVSGLVGVGGTYALIVTALGGGNPFVGALLLGGAVLAVGTSATLDIIRAPRAAQSWNERHKLSISPVFDFRSSDIGIAARLRF